MMRIIVLCGIENTGKSITLNILYNMLVPALAQTNNNRTVLGNAAQNDFFETIIYRNQTVEFFTMGDYPSFLEKAIKNAASRQTDVFICACSKFSPALRATFQTHKTAFISKAVSVINHQQAIFNTSDAQLILNTI